MPFIRMISRKVATAFKNSIATGNPYNIEHRCRRMDGVYRWFQARGSPGERRGIIA